jgi:hypothetical protein
MASADRKSVGRLVVQYNFYINDRRWGRMFVRIFPYLSPRASTSISITGSPTGCVRRASTSSNAPMPSSDARRLNASSTLRIRSVPASYWIEAYRRALGGDCAAGLGSPGDISAE